MSEAARYAYLCIAPPLERDTALVVRVEHAEEVANAVREAHAFEDLVQEWDANRWESCLEVSEQEASTSSAKKPLLEGPTFRVDYVVGHAATMEAGLRWRN